MYGQESDELKVFKHQRSMVTTVRGVEVEVQRRVLEESKVPGTVRSVLKGRTMI